MDIKKLVEGNFKNIASAINKFKLTPPQANVINILLDEARDTINAIINNVEIVNSDNYSLAIDGYATLIHSFVNITELLMKVSWEVEPTRKEFTKMGDSIRDYMAEKMAHKCLED